jgi:hypothetical protein
MNLRRHGIIFFTVLLLLTACSSGTWEDDSKNWERIYNQDKPDNVNVIHSWYWRSSHWSYEYEFYIETDSNKQILESFISKADLVQIEDPTKVPTYELFPDDKPKWFVPKPLDKYEVWTGNGFFKLFIDKETGHLYWCDSQL